ncbi:hypothetical protein BpHYR1_014027 [Brachionus plicatilis]|uniref:Uncharacterized protein n=1 Tax=Brachionus plicatilis TaxID=10195 RepID=A0A3M7P298_BRAPC|nr:hypothetical protein BpHYR1_014027 [Brachionus plicatilis]
MFSTGCHIIHMAFNKLNRIYQELPNKVFRQCLLSIILFLIFKFKKLKNKLFILNEILEFCHTIRPEIFNSFLNN